MLLSCYSPRALRDAMMGSLHPLRLAVMNCMLAWMAIIGMVVAPLLLGMLFEQKLQPATRELGPRLLRRY